MSRNGNKHRLLLESNQRKIQLVVETGLLKRQMICLALTSNTLLNYQYCCLRHCVCPEWDNSWSYSVTSFEDGECNVNVASTTYNTCHVADLSCYTSGCVRLPAFYQSWVKFFTSTFSSWNENNFHFIVQFGYVYCSRLLMKEICDITTFIIQILLLPEEVETNYRRNCHSELKFYNFLHEICP